ncbi:SpoIIE family protein phosphatase [Candidatus Ferrigenium straubiae]|jgi:PAS domain S-box-containing protein|uniref:SpoIIE family protein phosphatase n=1 Tax=Candidatus Ferrigenium straubiae TaxID=2919506 RepID=UPI003F4A9395
MRLNLPVSNIESQMPDGVIMVTKTDLKGVITYCNQTFVDINGRSREEIIGAPHNVVRHPDMPPEVFADLWKTIKANKPWQGIVKNRRKDGSFYWAVSNVTPLLEKGKTVGYVSFRYKATQEQIDSASEAYREIRKGSPRLRIEEGNIIRIKSPLLHWLSAASVKARLFALIFVLLGAMVVTGIYSLYQAEKAHDRTVEGLATASVQAYALATARSAEAAFKEQRHAWKNILIRGHDAASLKRYTVEFDRRREEVEQILVGQLIPIMQQIGLSTDGVDALLGEHVLLTSKYHSALKTSDVRDLKNIPAIDALSAGVDQQITEQFNAIIATIREAQLHGLGDLNETLEKSHNGQRSRSAAILLAFALGGLVLSVWFIIGILRPIRRASSNFDRVVQLQQHFLEKILVLEEYLDRLDEEQRIGSYIMGHITKVHGELDPLIRHLIRPAEHLSGDMLLAARTPDDALHILLADAVGHGLVAAVNVLPLSQAFYDMTENGFRITQIAEELNLKIHRFMPVDRFVAVTLVSINVRNRVIEVWNGGNPAPVLVGKNGKILHEWESTNLPLGILPGESFSGKPEIFQYEENCQLCLFSDGLPEAESPLGEPFGRDRIRKLLQDSNPRGRFENLVGLLDAHLGGKPAHDDVSLAMIEVPTYLRAEAVPVVHVPVQAIAAGTSNWKIEISLGAAELKYLNIVPMLTNIIEKIHVANEFAAPLFMILSELFNNALDHGILQLDSGLKHGADGFDKFLELRDERLHALEGGKIDLEIEKVVIEGKYGVKIRVADSGEGFDYAAALAGAEDKVKHGQHGRGITLVESMSYKLEYAGRGNDVTAYYVCA